MQQRKECIRQTAAATKTTHLILLLILVTALVLDFLFIQTAIAQEVFLQTGFEKESLGKPPEDWDIRGNQFEVTDDVVKTDKKSLGILGGADDDRVGVAIDTENPIISVEFWVLH